MKQTYQHLLTGFCTWAREFRPQSLRVLALALLQIPVAALPCRCVCAELSLELGWGAPFADVVHIVVMCLDLPPVSFLHCSYCKTNSLFLPSTIGTESIGIREHTHVVLPSSSTHSPPHTYTH